MSAEFSFPEQPKRFFSRRLVLGCCLTPVVLFFLLVVGVGIWWTLWNRQLNQKLADEIALVRARGEPLTTLELNDYYQPAKGRPDMTKEILVAFDACLDPNLKPLWERLPFTGTPQEFGFPEEVPASSQRWEQLAEVEAFLAKQPSALATFHEVALRKGTARYPSDYTLGYNTPIEQVQGVRQACRLLSLEFHAHLHLGRTTQAVDSILAQMAMAQTLDGDPCMVSQLVRVAVGRESLKLTQHGLKEGIWAEVDLVRLQAGIRDFQFPTALRTALVGERASSFAACFDPLLMADPKSKPTSEQVRKMLSRPPQRVADAGKILEIYSQLIESSDQPISRSIATGKAVEAEMDALGKSPFTQLTYIMTLLQVPAVGISAQTFAGVEAHRDAADAAIAAEIYRRRHGEWPKTLDQLVPTLIPRIPNDPFTDQPQQYRISAEGIRIYSLGNNLQDNVGRFSDLYSPGSDVGCEVKSQSKP